MKKSQEQLLELAIEMACSGHKNQSDKFGTPYIFHPLRVMQMGKTWDEKIVGILHDVIEDSPLYSIKDLETLGFPPHIVEALVALNRKDESEDYEVLIERIQKNPLATAVKINDLKDNMDLTRFKKPISERDCIRLNKYLKAYQKLTNNNN